MKDAFTNDYLTSIIDNYLNTTITYDWRYYIIKYESMRPEKYGMYYWYDYKDREKESYRILMMMTEKSIGGRNFNIFLKTLMDIDNSLDFSLGEYAYSGDGDKIISELYGVYITCGDTKYAVFDLTDNTLLMQVEIPQDNKIDVKDRINIGLEVIRNVREINKVD